MWSQTYKKVRSLLACCDEFVCSDRACFRFLRRRRSKSPSVDCDCLLRVGVFSTQMHVSDSASFKHCTPWHQRINDSLSFSVWTITHAWSTNAPEHSSKTCSRTCAPVERQAFSWWAIMKLCVRSWAAFTVSFRHLYLLLDYDGGPTAIHLLAYFASCSLPNIHSYSETVVSYPCPVSLSCWVDVVEFGADACRCGN